MLERIIEALKKGVAKNAAPAAGAEVKRLAAAALMIEAARRDNDFADDERTAITRIVGEHFKLTSDDAKALVDLAEQRQKVPFGETIFTRTVRDSFTPEERKDVLRMMWEVANADGHLHRLEGVMIERLAVEIGLNKADSESARAEVTAKS